jgi:hypothetical protein
MNRIHSSMWAAFFVLLVVIWQQGFRRDSRGYSERSGAVVDGSWYRLQAESAFQARHNFG